MASPSDLLNADLNLATLDGVATSNAVSVNDRLGQAKLTLAEIQRRAEAAVAAAGFYPVAGSFEAGGTITERNQVLLRTTAPTAYFSWGGELNKAVPPGSTVAGTGGEGVLLWTNRNDATFAAALADEESSVPIAGIVAGIVAAVISKFNIDAGRLQSVNITIGDQTITGATLRDAVVVARNINGPTDCHAFADRTVIQNATDTGTYGTFDSTTTLSGTHTQAHIYSYQDRVNVNGSAGSVLTDSTGVHIDSRNNGAGTVVNRIGVHVIDMANLGGGSITNSTGIVIRNITQATNNIALQIDQSSTSTFAYYAPNGGAMHNGGKVGFGVVPSSSFAVRFSNGAGTENAFCATAANTAMFGAEGNSIVSIMSNGAARLQVQQSGNTYNVTPGTTNAQYLGQADKRWLGLFAGQVTFTGISAASAINNSIFVDSADNLLKFKNSAGSVSAI